MEVILLEKIRNLGNLGDKVSVKPGYGRNFLMPQGKAVPATKANIEHFEAQRAEFEAKAAAKLEAAKERAKALEGKELIIKALAGDEGKLFGSVGTHEIAHALNEQGFDVHKSEVILSTGAFRYVGEYEIELQLHSDIATTIKLTIAEDQG